MKTATSISIPIEDIPCRPDNSAWSRTWPRRWRNGLLQRMCTGFDKGGGVTSSVRLQQELAELECRVEAAVPLGLIANEALTNAFQHAY